MEIYLGRQAVRQIREASLEAIEDGDNEILREEILDAFSEEDVQAIEQILESDDFYDFINNMLDDWSGEDVDELFDLMESQFAEVNIELVTEYSGDIDEEEDEDEDEDDDEEEKEEEEPNDEDDFSIDDDRSFDDDLDEEEL